MLREPTRRIPALLVVNHAILDRLDYVHAGHEDDEYLTRPYTAESIRWRVEAMCIRSVAVDDGSGPVLQGASTPATGRGAASWSPCSTPRVASARRRSPPTSPRCSWTRASGSCSWTPTRSPAMSRRRWAWTPCRPSSTPGATSRGRANAQRSTSWPPSTRRASGCCHCRRSPIHTEILDPDRVAAGIAAARAADYVIVDLHPSYSLLNRAIFDKADRILVPVTPDLPAIRAVMKLREVAEELGMRDRLCSSSTARTAACRSRTSRRPWGCPPTPRSARPALADRQGDQRGTDSRGHRAEGAGHTGLQRARGPAPGPRARGDSANDVPATVRPPGRRPRLTASGTAKRPADAAGRADVPGRADAVERPGPCRTSVTRSDGTGQFRVGLAGPPVHLGDAPQIEAVDEDHVHVGLADLRRRRASRPRPPRARTSRWRGPAARPGSEPGCRNTVPMTRNGGASRATS